MVSPKGQCILEDWLSLKTSIPLTELLLVCSVSTKLISFTRKSGTLEVSMSTAICVTFLRKLKIVDIFKHVGLFPECRGCILRNIVRLLCF